MMCPYLLQRFITPLTLKNITLKGGTRSASLLVVILFYDDEDTKLLYYSFLTFSTWRINVNKLPFCTRNIKGQKKFDYYWLRRDFRDSNRVDTFGPGVPRYKKNSSCWMSHVCHDYSCAMVMPSHVEATKIKRRANNRSQQHKILFKTCNKGLIRVSQEDYDR